jgi:hypothetical protein
MKCLDDGNEGALELAARRIDAQRSGRRAEGQFVDESASDRERSQPRQAIGQPATNRCSTTDK